MAAGALLHVGTPKSGTTYLQALLWENRDRLTDVNVHLPMQDRRDHNQAVGDLAGQVRRVLPGIPPTTWAQMAAAIDGVSGTAVISEELFATVGDEGRRRVIDSLPGTPVHVVITARDPIRQVPSMWQQSLKHGNYTALPEFAAKIVRDENQQWRLQQDLAGLAARWAELLPAEQVHVVTVPQRGAAPGLLWERFAQVLGIDPDSCAPPDELANETLDTGQAEVLRRVNAALRGRLPFPQPYVSVIRHKVVPALIANPGGGRITLPAEHLDWASDFAHRTIERIKELGVDVVGDLDDLVGTPPEEIAEPLDEKWIAAMAIATLADFAVAEVETFGQVDELRARVRKVKGRNAKLQARNKELAAKLEDRPARRGLRSLLRRRTR